MGNDTRLDRIDPTLIRRVRAMGRPYDRFIELVDGLLDRNPAFDPDEAEGSQGQRVASTLAIFDAQMRNGGVLQFFWNCPDHVDRIAPALLHVGVPDLAEQVERVAEQLARGGGRFAGRRASGGLGDYVAASKETDLEWFDTIYFGRFDQRAQRWTGMAETVYACAVRYMLDHLDAFVRPAGGGA